ncbi:cytochrome c [Fodinibius sp.]|uniref:c-type cytochrome n=1 Tax=Fodinibius sp. TaxID=1872440 RepID=UPI003562B3AC
MKIKQRSGSLLFLMLTFFFIAAITQTNDHDKNSNKLVEAASDTVLKTPTTGEKLYSEACAACHGVSGKGVAQSQLGFATPVPDFSDCDFASREPDGDWIAVAHQGGPVRGFGKDMPAFGMALSEQELQQIMDHIRTLCRDDNWPRGELNLPRPLVTEKAYPEDEAVISTSVDMENEGSVMNELVYEQRFGARNQVEIVMPFGFRESPTGSWNGGQLGDMALGIKRAVYHNIDNGSIFSVTGEVIFPTGDRATGFGKGTTIFEPFVSFGQLLPANSFLHVQSGVELPVLRDKATEEAFWRAALGTSLTHGSWGRTWSPMVEVLGSREFESGAVNHWDIAPQVQVTLNKRQHIMMNVGVRIPADDASRDTQFMVYILWDWFDGGPFEGW